MRKSYVVLPLDGGQRQLLPFFFRFQMGILHILDDESSFPKATDQSFLEKCHYNHGTNALYQRPKQFAHCFSVVHYAGDVSYTVTGFLDKNRDTLRADVIELFIGSGLTVNFLRSTKIMHLHT